MGQSVSAKLVQMLHVEGCNFLGAKELDQHFVSRMAWGMNNT